MQGSKAARWVKFWIGSIVVVVAALAVWGIYEDLNPIPPGSSGAAAPAVSGGSVSTSIAQLPAPDKIGAMRPVSVNQGREAVFDINQIHGTNVGVNAGCIASYAGSGSEAMIWVAQTAGSTEAQRLVDLMTAKIRPGNAYFTGLQELQRRGKVVYTVNSGGQKHYYYQASEKVVWLAVSEQNPENITAFRTATPSIQSLNSL